MIFKDKYKKSNYKIVNTKKGRVVKFNIFGNIWLTLRQQDFKQSFWNLKNRIIIYFLIILISIILPFITKPVVMLFYILYISFVVFEDVANRREFFYQSLDFISNRIDGLLIKETHNNYVEMMFDEKGNEITGEQLTRINKFKRIMK